MPSRRSDRGDKLKRQPGESDLDLTNRKSMTAVTLAPLFGLQGLGILAGASALHTGASAKADAKKKLDKGVEPREGRPPVPDRFRDASPILESSNLVIEASDTIENIKNNSRVTPIGTKGTSPGASIQNANGTSSSEQTISIGVNGKTFLIPTIIPDANGILTKHSNAEAIKLFKAGKNPAVGEFNSVKEADEFAGKRSASGGRDSTITQLTDSILQSAAGRPFNFSISEGKKKKDMARQALIAMMTNGILSPEVTNDRESMEAQLNAFEQKVNVDKAKKKGNPKVVHPETRRANKKEQAKSTST